MVRRRYRSKYRAAVLVLAPAPFSFCIALDSRKGKFAADPGKAGDIRQHLEGEPGWAPEVVLPANANGFRPPRDNAVFTPVTQYSVQV